MCVRRSLRLQVSATILAGITRKVCHIPTVSATPDAIGQRVQNIFLTRSEIARAQWTHEATRTYLVCLNGSNVAETAGVPHDVHQYCVAPDGVLMWRGGTPGVERIVVPPGLRNSVIASVHAWTGHRGVRRTLPHILHQYYWGKRHRMERDVIEYVRLCPACIQRPPLERVESSEPLPRPSLSPEPRQGGLQGGALGDGRDALLHNRRFRVLNRQGRVRHGTIMYRVTDDGQPFAWWVIFDGSTRMVKQDLVPRLRLEPGEPLPRASLDPSVGQWATEDADPTGERWDGLGICLRCKFGSNAVFCPVCGRRGGTAAEELSTPYKLRSSRQGHAEASCDDRLEQCEQGRSQAVVQHSRDATSQLRLAELHEHSCTDAGPRQQLVVALAHRAWQRLGFIPRGLCVVGALATLAGGANVALSALRVRGSGPSLPAVFASADSELREAMTQVEEQLLASGARTLEGTSSVGPEPKLWETDHQTMYLLLRGGAHVAAVVAALSQLQKAEASAYLTSVMMQTVEDRLPLPMPSLETPSAAGASASGPPTTAVTRLAGTASAIASVVPSPSAPGGTRLAGPSTAFALKSSIVSAPAADEVTASEKLLREQARERQASEAMRELDIAAAPASLKDAIRSVGTVCDLVGANATHVGHLIRQISGYANALAVTADVEHACQVLAVEIMRTRRIPTDEQLHTALTAYLMSPKRPGSAPPTSPSQATAAGPPTVTRSLLLPTSLADRPTARRSGRSAEREEDEASRRRVPTPEAPVWWKQMVNDERAVMSAKKPRAFSLVFREREPDSDRRGSSRDLRIDLNPYGAADVKARVDYPRAPKDVSQAGKFALGRAGLTEMLGAIYAARLWDGQRPALAARGVRDVLIQGVRDAAALSSLQGELDEYFCKEDAHEGIKGILHIVEEHILPFADKAGDAIAALYQVKWEVGETATEFLTRLRQTAKGLATDGVNAEQVILSRWEVALEDGISMLKAHGHDASTLEFYHETFVAPRAGKPQSVNALVSALEAYTTRSGWCMPSLRVLLSTVGSASMSQPMPVAATTGTSASETDAFVALALTAEGADSMEFVVCCALYSSERQDRGGKTFPPRGAWNVDKLMLDNLLPSNFATTFFCAETRKTERVNGRQGLGCPGCRLTLAPFMQHMPITKVHVHSQIDPATQQAIAANIGGEETTYHWLWKCPRLALWATTSVKRDPSLGPRFDACILTDAEFVAIMKEKARSESSTSRMR